MACIAFNRRFNYLFPIVNVIGYVLQQSDLWKFLQTLYDTKIPSAHAQLHVSFHTKVSMHLKGEEAIRLYCLVICITLSSCYIIQWHVLAAEAGKYDRAC